MHLQGGVKTVTLRRSFEKMLLRKSLVRNCNLRICQESKTEKDKE